MQNMPKLEVSKKGGTMHCGQQTPEPQVNPREGKFDQKGWNGDLLKLRLIRGGRSISQFSATTQFQ